MDEVHPLTNASGTELNVNYIKCDIFKDTTFKQTLQRSGCTKYYVVISNTTMTQSITNILNYSYEQYNIRTLKGK
jgi:hypothetical protein